MSHEAKALALVREYTRLMDLIAGCKPRIGAALDLCEGVKGNRLKVQQGAFDGSTWTEPTGEAAADHIHLEDWYTAEHDDDGQPCYPDFNKHECPHCWAAHLVVQERKQARKALGSVKGVMRKLGRLASPVLSAPTSPHGNSVSPPAPSQPEPEQTANDEGANVTPVYKITVLVVDHDRIGMESAMQALENGRYGNDCIDPRCLAAEQREVDWSDAHPLNHTTTSKAFAAELFAAIDAASAKGEK